MANKDMSTTDIELDIEDDEQSKEEQGSEEASSPDYPRRESQLLGQKRRRVTRACDECRRKKIKCDGKQPCTHCTVYSYDCTYDQPSNRRRNPGPQYVEAIERRLHRAEAVLQTIAPHIDLDDPSLDTTSEQPVITKSNPGSAARKSPVKSPALDVPRVQVEGNEDGLESMIRATGQLDLDETGRWEYYGHSSGLSFLRRLRDQFGNVLHSDDAGSRSTTFSKREIGQDFTTPRSPGQLLDSPFETMQLPSVELPSKEEAERLCSNTLDDASAILNLVHQPSFYKSFDRIYRLPRHDYESQDEKFLPLLHSVMALGCLFDKTEDSELKQGGYESATTKGYKYIVAARRQLDITNCRDLTSLQAIIFMIIFLQCSAKLATCYSYIGIALRSAIRMGLHRSFRDGFTPIEAEARKRAFWVVRKMDIYVGAMLGLPLTLSPEDFDQDLPTEVDDEYITEEAIMPMPPGSVPLATASVANFKLARILAKIVKGVYPIKGTQNIDDNPSRSYSISFTTICELERDLKMWEEELPAALKPGGVKPASHIGPMQQLLRLAYAHAQMMLYRPFLHYVSPRSQPTTDKRAYGCAAACISVSRNVIHITTTMKNEGLLVGSYWFTMYTAFFAVLSLLYFAAENPENPTSRQLMRDAREGREALAQLAKRSMAADRCTTTLNTVFQALEATLEDIEKKSQTPKGPSGRKREASQSLSGPQNLESQLPSADNLKLHLPPRAKTFPLNPSTTSSQLESTTQKRHQKKSQGNSRKGQQRTAKDPAAESRSTSNSTTSAESASGSFGFERPVVEQGPTRSLHSSSVHHQQERSERQSLSYEQPQHHYQQPTQTSLSQSHQFYSTPLSNLPHTGDLSDLSAIMFPSADPFAYPNQPMTTLEQNYGYHHGISTTRGPDYGLRQDNHIDYMRNTTGAQTRGERTDEHIDAQLFGPMPMYLMQHQDTYPQVPEQTPAMDGMSTEQSIQGQGQHWQGQVRSHGLDNFNYDDVFGNEEEWRGFM